MGFTIRLRSLWETTADKISFLNCYTKKHSSYLFTSLSFTERRIKGKILELTTKLRIPRSLQLLGDYSGDVTPVPIPNTVVKLSSADDTGNSRESRSLPGL